MEHTLSIEQESLIMDSTIIKGHRVVDLQYVLEKTIDMQYSHSLICTFGKLQIANEYHKGFQSEVVMNCNMCNKIFKLQTENPKLEKSVVNNGFVWGTLSGGSTYGQAQEILTHGYTSNE